MKSGLSATSKMGRRHSAGDDQIVELTSIIETAKILNSSLDYKFILNHILLASMGKLAVSKTAAVIRLSPNLGKSEEGYLKICKGIPVTDEMAAGLLSLDLEGSSNVSDINEELSRQVAAAGARKIFALRSSHRLFGYMLIGKKLVSEEFAPSEIEFVSSLCNIAAAAIENANVFQQYKDSNFELQRRVQELQTLFELSKEFNLLIEESRAIRTLEFAVMGQTGSRNYAICLSNDAGSRLVVNKGLPGLPVDEMKAVCSVEQPTRLSEIAETIPLAKEFIVKGAEVVIPFQLQGNNSGMLILGERHNRSAYSDSEISFLSSLCNLAAMAIDNARLFEESMAKQRLEEELNIAHTIQEKLLPREMPAFAGCEIGTFHIPSKQVGGDYFDVIKSGEDSICVAIADVSGKGFPAALLMANLQSAFRALIAARLSIGEIVVRLNNIVYANTDFDRFITFFGAVYDSTKKVITYVNAGHNYPFLMKRNGDVVRLDKGGLMLGVMQNVKYETGRQIVDAEDVLYMFTDGINEALNSEDEQFSEERLEDVLTSVRSSSAEQILEKVKEEVEAFVGNAPQSDDITQLCVKFK